jgi:hypothetical protein
MSALDFAQERGHVDMAELLRNHSKVRSEYRACTATLGAGAVVDAFVGCIKGRTVT